MKKIFFWMFIFLNCMLSFAYEKKIEIIPNQLYISIDSDNYIGEICNQHYVTSGTEISIDYKLSSGGSSGGDANSSGGGGYNDILYIDEVLIENKTTNNNLVRKTLNVAHETDISVAIYRKSFISGGSDSYTCLGATIIRASKKFDAKISNYNVGNLYGAYIPIGGTYDLFISIPESNWFFNDETFFVKKGTSIEVDFEERLSDYINYYVTIGSDCLEKNVTAIIITEEVDISIIKKITPPMGLPPEEEILFTQKIKVDGEVPSINVLPSYKEGTWATNNVTVSVQDEETKIKSFFVKKGNEERHLQETDTIILQDEGKYVIEVTDLGDNATIKEIWIDKTYPKIKVNGETVKEDNIYTDSIITIKAEDYGSGVAEFCVNGNTITGSDYTITQCGKYTIFVKDKAGNKITKEISIDNEPPVINGEIIFQQGENLLNGIAINTTVNEENAISWIKIKHNEEENKILTNKYTKEIEEREEFHTYQIQIGAKDKAGNQVEKELAVINVPPKIKVSVDEESKRIIKENGEEYTATDLILDNYEKYTKYYKEIKLTKVIYVCDGESDKKIDDSNFNNYFSPEAQFYWQEITEEKVISADEIKDGKYTDKIKTSSGFGHKKTGYILSWGIEGIEGIREKSEEVKTKTANREGKVDIKIIGKEIDGNSSVLDIDFNDGKANCEGYIEIPADGSIYIECKIEDKDSEPYEIEVKQKVKLNGLEKEILVSKESFIQKGNTGYSIFDKKNYPNVYREEQWYRFSTPEYLAYNKQTCLVIRVKEGYGSDAIDKELGEIYLKAEPLDLGGFNLQVCEEAEYNFFGITASPFQDVQMEVEGRESITWNFGDGNIEERKKISHAWGQSSERKGSVSEYILTLTTKETEEQGVEIPIHIVDTKAGALYGNEEWIGEHEILGPVIVPYGKTLTIGRGTDSTDEINILCIEDSNEKYMGSIEVSNGGKLKINNGTEKVRIVSGENTNKGIVEETEEDIFYWKGIRIKDGGEAEIENAEIMGSKRCVIVEKRASLIIKESLLSKNEIGLHVFGSCEIEDVEITENKEYGVKEEKDCKEITVLGTNRITENNVDWYDWNAGVLTEDEIKNRK